MSQKNTTHRTAWQTAAMLEQQRFDIDQVAVKRETDQHGIAGGGEKASAPVGRQWQLLTTTKITQRGTHENRRKVLGADHCGTQNRTRPSAGHIDASALPTSGPGTAQGRPPTNHCRSQTDAKHFTRCHTDGNAGAGSSTRGAAASSQAAKRGTSSQAGRLAKYSEVISHPLRYGLRSCLRLIGGGLGKFWPIFMPVIWAHFLAGHCAARKVFYSFAVDGCNGFLSGTPVGYHGWGDTQMTCHSQRPTTLHIDPIVEFHCCIISHGVSVCQ